MVATTTAGWFDYPVRVSPHHTDHGGIVWHGSYLTWMEEARVEALRAIGVDYADFVKVGCELPVVDLALRYRKSLRLGEMALIRCQMQAVKGVRLVWDYEIRSPDYATLYLTGQVTLVAMDWQKGKIMRKLPPTIAAALVKITKR
ncbi:acyl-CoA thioesterase [filamentous cyanobacterium LEGE 11480]|uniref:Acyl-CoA thioesterase n=1 Tax=Romeriopsis navalis LEGE 11480 TaxID=2777977 RepID=A0A928Z2E4_9CYAN|nr:thioesterase family protein [Romeriopsis navalis]MBE9028310.1 acyl-CoA thioesterase [Romeriopsis navalis LEGE 11480]